MKVISNKNLSIPLQGCAVGNNQTDAILNFDNTSPLSKCVIGRTNIGKGRDKNQDAASSYFCDCAEPCIILTIADGLGYYENSEKGAFDAVTRLPQWHCEGEDISASFRLLHGELIQRYPYKIKGYALEGRSNDRGATTVVMASIHQDHLTLAHVGDSRAYLIRDSHIIFRSRDQGMVELLVSRGHIPNDPALLRRHPQRNVLLNALGSPESSYQFEVNGQIVTRQTGDPSIEEIELEKNDYLLLATDGVFTNLTDENIINLITKTPWEQVNENISQCIQNIFNSNKTDWGEAANFDNYTYVVYRHGKGAPSP